VGEAGDVATLPAQTEQVVVPSAICAPHMLQKAIKVSSRLSFGLKGAARQVASDRCQVTLRQGTKKRKAKQSTISYSREIG
jgi:hypothetical protein